MNDLLQFIRDLSQSRNLHLIAVVALLAGCDLSQERLVCWNEAGKVTYRSEPTANWTLVGAGMWIDSPNSKAYRQSVFEGCATVAEPK